MRPGQLKRIAYIEFYHQIQTQYGSRCFCGNTAPPKSSLRPIRFEITEKQEPQHAEFKVMKLSVLIMDFNHFMPCYIYKFLFPVSATAPADITQIVCVKSFGG